MSAMNLSDANMVNNLMAFENGEMHEEDVYKLFQNLVDTGLAWQLQGMYGRTARLLIDAGLVTAKVSKVER